MTVQNPLSTASEAVEAAWAQASALYAPATAPPLGEYLAICRAREAVQAASATIELARQRRGEPPADPRIDLTNLVAFEDDEPGKRPRRCRSDAWRQEADEEDGEEVEDCEGEEEDTQ